MLCLLDEIWDVNEKIKYEYVGYCVKGIILLMEIFKGIVFIYGGVIVCNFVVMFVGL